MNKDAKMQPARDQEENQPRKQINAVLPEPKGRNKAYPSNAVSQLASSQESPTSELPLTDARCSNFLIFRLVEFLLCRGDKKGYLNSIPNKQQRNLLTQIM